MVMVAYIAAIFALLQLAAAAAIPHHPHHPRHPRAAHEKRQDNAYHAVHLPLLSYNHRIYDPAYLMLSMKLPAILGRAIQITHKSWEIGTLTQALLEVYNPRLAPWAYSDASFHSALDRRTTTPIEAARVAAGFLVNYDFSGAPASGDVDAILLNGTPRALVDGAGSLGDPCALGTATWVLAHFADSLANTGTPLATNEQYAWAVGNQLAYLQAGPRSENGTISQREDHFELWADQGYMIPPFLAYLGLTTNNTQLLEQALDQWLLVSSALLDTNHNLYRHLNTWDTRFWATGNGWMLAGLMRVLGSIEAAGGGLDAKVREAEAIAARVFQALFDRLDGGRIPNYMGAETDPRYTAGDSAGTAAVVGAFYRFLVMRPDLAGPMKGAAEQAFAAVVDKIDTDAWLTAVVDPQGTNGFLVYPDQNTRSPEGQSLLAVMWAARTAAGQ
ncbi:hypothetical protein CC85DRAFT_288182 [Cutaneotrichosporon oleaginosum]|uniref:Six-hairpin glycosidase n=1 Tax=Cutaneotrichosporon oleaginosum TaxID=879819 RepID=A0A0J0XFD8_9TREE|nr:uncharacterized protein CC85DRAFT_288182 [Cutaneotrichosporon oleaginosum]KLT39763.1 hypothetical protein CC85DRAFT_288182 [Cutaneotrichosporon oleaginosum]TXT05692.1 hypothetical protein COLE_07012 [Cutaneotrichosporon oleaginosum]